MQFRRRTWTLYLQLVTIDWYRIQSYNVKTIYQSDWPKRQLTACMHSIINKQISTYIEFLSTSGFTEGFYSSFTSNVSNLYTLTMSYRCVHMTYLFRRSFISALCLLISDSRCLYFISSLYKKKSLLKTWKAKTILQTDQHLSTFFLISNCINKIYTQDTNS